LRKGCAPRQDPARHDVFYGGRRVGNKERQHQPPLGASAAYVQQSQRSAPGVFITVLGACTICRTGVSAGEDPLVVVRSVVALLLVHYHNNAVELSALHTMLRGIGGSFRDISFVRPKLLCCAPEELEHCRVRGSPFGRSVI